MTVREWVLKNRPDIKSVYQNVCPDYILPTEAKGDYFPCNKLDNPLWKCSQCWDLELPESSQSSNLREALTEFVRQVIDGDADEEKEVIGLVSTSALQPETLRVAIEVLVEDLGNRHRFEQIADDLYRSDPDSEAFKHCLIEMSKRSVAVERALADLERYRKELEESGLC